MPEKVLGSVPPTWNFQGVHFDSSSANAFKSCNSCNPFWILNIPTLDWTISDTGIPIPVVWAWICHLLQTEWQAATLHPSLRTSQGEVPRIERFYSKSRAAHSADSPVLLTNSLALAEAGQFVARTEMLGYAVDSCWFWFPLISWFPPFLFPTTLSGFPFFFADFPSFWFPLVLVSSGFYFASLPWISRAPAGRQKANGCHIWGDSHSFTSYPMWIFTIPIYILGFDALIHRQSWRQHHWQQWSNGYSARGLCQLDIMIHHLHDSCN